LKEAQLPKRGAGSGGGATSEGGVTGKLKGSAQGSERGERRGGEKTRVKYIQGFFDPINFLLEKNERK
jgi:hypothetical protein